MNTKSLRMAMLALLLFAGFAAQCFGQVVYTFGPGNFHPNGTTIAGGPITNADGSISVQANCTGAGYHDLIVVNGQVKQNMPYTAILTYRVLQSPYPTTFYMHSHSHTLGAAADTWQTFLGTPGQECTARLPFVLTTAPDWLFYMGCNGPGSIIIDSFIVQDGTGYAYNPAVTGTKSNTPLGGALPTGATGVTITPPSPTTSITINAASYGLVADQGSTPASLAVQKANYTAITNAIAAAKSQHAATLSFPTGTYRFWSTSWILFQNVSDLTIDGQGSTFIFENINSNGYAIDFLTSQRCVIKNLYMDWDWSVEPIGCLGTVQSIAANQLSAVITFPNLNATQTTLVTKSPWMSMAPMDPTTLLRTANVSFTPSIASFTNQSGNTVTVNFNSALALTAGTSYCIRSLYYNMAAFRVESSSNILFSSVRIYSMPGMGWLTRGETSNLELSSCTIAPRSGSTNPYSTAADGFHVEESLGNIELSGCYFSHLGDDCVNIHDICFEGVTRTSDNVLTLNGNQSDQVKFNLGDTIELDNADYSPMGYTLTVTGISYTTGSSPTTVLTVADTLPANILLQDIVWNHHYSTSNVLITHCTFQNTQGRGVLFGGQNATITYSVFDHTYSTGLKVHTDIQPGLWAEGHGASNLVVEYNTFNYNNARGEYDASAIYVTPVLPAGPSTYGLFNNILIYGNNITDAPGPAVSIGGSADVTVNLNTIYRSTDAPDITYLSGSLFGAYASNLSLGGNTWASSPAPAEPGEVTDPATTTGILPGVNVLSN